jgi:hypothetical protein
MQESIKIEGNKSALDKKSLNNIARTFCHLYFCFQAARNLKSLVSKKELQHLPSSLMYVFAPRAA